MFRPAVPCFGSDAAIAIARRRGGHLGDRPHAHRMVVAPGQQCRPGRRAYRGAVKPIELQPFSREPLSGGVLQGPPKAEAAPKPTSSSMTIKMLGATLGWAQHSDRRIGRGWNLGVVGRQTNMLRIWNRHLLDRHDIFHHRLARFCGEPVHPVRTSRHTLPRRPGRARGLARPDGARDAVHLGRPVADQDWPDVAVVQDGAATAARAGKPLCAAAVSISAVRTDLRRVNCAMGRVSGKVLSGRLGGRQQSNIIQWATASPPSPAGCGRSRRRPTSVVNCRC